MTSNAMLGKAAMETVRNTNDAMSREIISNPGFGMGGRHHTGLKAE